MEKLPLPDHCTETQFEIITGLMLGDGNLHRYKGYNAVLSCARKWTDHSYNEFLHSFLHEFCAAPPVYGSTFDTRTNKTYEKSRWASRRCPVFNEIHTRWYEGKKIIPKDFRSEELTPLVCVIWFCDDGCVFAPNKKSSRLGLKLSTHGFTQSDNTRLAEMLSTKFKEFFSITNDAGNYYLTASDAGARAFIKYIDPHIPISMERKRTWTPEQLTTAKTFAQLKNRKILDFNEKEKAIIAELMASKEGLSPKSIASKIGWVNKTQPKLAPSGLSLYLKRFLEYNWVLKTGLRFSKTNGIKYHITDFGRSVLTDT